MARRRSSRAISNDAAIRAAAIELVLQVGVDAISFRDVGRVAGLTHGALYARFEDVEELLVDLWNEVLCHRAIDLLEVVVRAVSDPNEATVRAVVDRLRDTPNADIAMVEVLLTSRRFEVLHEEVESFIHDVGLRKTMLRAHRQACMHAYIPRRYCTHPLLSSVLPALPQLS